MPIPLNVLAVICDHYWMRTHLVPTLRSTFHSVEVFYYEGMAKWYDPKWVDSRSTEVQRLLSVVQSLRAAGKLDLLFMLVYDDFLSASAAREIKRLGVQMINYHVDMPNQWYRCIRTAPYFDVIGVANPAYFSALERYGGKLVYSPMAANTDYFQPLDHKKEYDVLFVGSYTPPRADVLAAATDVTDSVYVAGAGWEDTSDKQSSEGVRKQLSWRKHIHDLRYVIPRFLAEGSDMFATRNLGARTYLKGGRVGGARYLGNPTDIVDALNKARIVLGVSQRNGSLGSRKGCVRSLLRDFEAPACGTMYLVQRYPELGVHYIEDQEIVAWSDLDELRAKIDYYLTYEKERAEVARAGRRRVVQSHRWEHRYRAMCAHLPTTD